MSNYKSAIIVRPGGRSNGTTETPAAIQVCVTSNGGGSTLQRAEDMDDALALAAQASVTEHHMVCVEVDAQRVLRWDPSGRSAGQRGTLVPGNSVGRLEQVP